MVDTGRSSYLGVFARIILTLICLLSLQVPRNFAAVVTAAQPAFIHHKKSSHYTKPLKPVPLGELAPVPIELGNSGVNPLANFFDALSELSSAPHIEPVTSPNPNPEPAAPGTTQPPATQQPPVNAPELPVPSEPLSPEPSPSRIVRIIHFGDSHVASDYWAGVLREKFQARFGDAGPGFVLPGRPWPSIRYGEARSLDGQGWRTDGLRYLERDGVVGLGGLSLESYRELSPASASASFSQFQILAATSPGNACFKVQVDDSDVPSLNSEAEQIVPSEPAAKPAALFPEPSPDALGGGAAAAPAPVVSRGKKNHKKRHARHVPPDPPFNPWPVGSPLEMVELGNSTPLTDGLHQLSIRSSCGSWGRLLGVELNNGSRGVIYDTDGVNGARLEDLEKPLPALRAALLKQAQPNLIIVSYGTNNIGTGGFDAHEFEERAYQILSKLKQDSGNASILVTGPTDRGSPRRRTRALIQAGQAELQPALRRAALRAGCAYWDQQAAMGGRGSMTKWVRAGLGNYDYVHFTGAGYHKLADMLFDQLMIEYANYTQTTTPQPQ